MNIENSTLIIQIFHNYQYLYPESVTSNLEFPYKNIQIHKVNR